LPQIMTLRPALETLTGFQIGYLDHLELYALASMQTQTIYQGTSAPPEHLQELVAEATALRELLLSDATALANRGLIGGAKLGALKGSVGFRNVASDLLTLANMIRSNWDAVSTRTGVTVAELDRAEVVGDQLINDIGIREQAPAATSAVSIERQRAFTLFVRAYDQVRRGVCYLRWDEGDADSIAPSLYGGRRRKSGSEVNTPPEPAPAPTPSTTTAPVVAAPPVVRAAVGLPGADPFVH
jgi:hypothetical protein